MGVLQQIYDTGLGITMRESLWGYPIALAVHAIGMGFLVGVLTIVNLRLLGAFRRIPIQGLKPMMPVVWTGFALNAISGVLLFVSDAVELAKNLPFLFKIAMIVIGVFLALAMRRDAVFAAPERLDASAVGDGRTRLLALISLIVWTAAIVAGRLIAYLKD